MKKYILLLAAGSAIVATVVAGCGRGTVAEINGQKISQEDFYKYMKSRAGTQMLSQIFEDRFFLAMAKEEKVEPTDEQVEQQLAQIRKMADLDETLKESALTIEDVKAELKVQLARQNLALKDQEDNITEEELKEAYEMRKSQRYDIPERVKVEMVIFRSQEAADKAAKKLKNGTTLEKIGEDGSDDHSQLMKQLIPKSGPGVPEEISKAAFATAKDKLSKPVKVTFGGPGSEQWVILKAGDRLSAAKTSFKDAEPLLRGELALMKAMQDEDYEKDLRKARKNAKIKIAEPSLQPAEKSFRSPSPRMPGPM
ncbi:MAG: peptidyl-prolyl cis-trans isomerase [Armatimonadetes bacterium]|nr:peptidyl-prolyl cis-trans isomerase [Armatimonadota bacterium]